MSTKEDMTIDSATSMSEAPGKTSKFKTFWRKVYRPLGFQKGYNFPLFFIFGGAMIGFVLARLQYLNIGGTAPTSYRSGAAPGEWFANSEGHYRVGITIHLGAILPAGLLLVWQFLPVIRHKLLIVHRISGYIIVLLVLVSNAGALMIARRAFGGSMSTQAGIGTLAILTTISIFMAYYNIKRLQIDQHRAWMLRMAFYLGTIITLRIIMFVSGIIIAKVNSYDTIMSCGQITSIFNSTGPVNRYYPACKAANATFDPLVIVHAQFEKGHPEEVSAALHMTFGMAIWLAILMHGAGVEIYLALTPKEGTRLREVSYERQLERGFSHPGSAGLTSDRWGDAEPFQPVKA